MFQKMKKSKGFTLIEMLVVIAIIAVLVSIIVPVVGNSTAKAKAATDAANLRSAQSTLTIELLNKTDLDKLGSGTVSETYKDLKCKSNDAWKFKAVVNSDGSVSTYFVDETSGQMYGIDYFAEIAQDGSAETSPKPVPTTTG